jgi:hypothetical protein
MVLEPMLDRINWMRGREFRGMPRIHAYRATRRGRWPGLIALIGSGPS